MTQEITVDVIRRRVYEAIPGNDNWREGEHDMNDQFGKWGLNFCDILLRRIDELEQKETDDIKPINACRAKVRVSYEAFVLARDLVKDIADDAVVLTTDEDIILGLGEECKKDDWDDPKTELYWLLRAAQEAGYDYLVVRD